MATLAADAQAGAVARLLVGGVLRLYTAPVPEDAESTPAGELLAELRFGRPAFLPPAGGAVKALPITPDREARADGTAAWFRCLTSAGAAVLDGSVGTPGSEANLEMATVEIRRGAEVYVDEFTFAAKVGRGI